MPHARRAPRAALWTGLAAAVALFAAACVPPSTPRPTGTTRSTDRAAATGPRTAVILAINDTYRIEGLASGEQGGLARARTLRSELEAEHSDLVVLHAGDILFPSLISRLYEGEQMIDGLNLLDGDPRAFDERLFVTFGNHEFDKGKASDAAMVDQRVDASGFTWVTSNVTFVEPEGGGALIGGDNLTGSALLESGGIRLGIFGLTTDSSKPAYVRFADPEATARRMTADLRSRGAEVVVALTHLDLAEDVALLRSLGDAGPDLIVGGHEHTAQEEEVGGRWVYKAHSDAATASVIRLTLGRDGKLAVDRRLVPLTGDSPPPDPELARLAEEWTARHAERFCSERDQPPTCLDEVVGRSRTTLEAEETKIRAYETTLGNWVADQMLATFADRGAQVAFINSGSLRLNRDLPPGEITVRDLEELFEYPSPLRLLTIDGATLAEVATHSVEGWPGKGWWLATAGFAFRHDPDADRAYDLTLLGPDGPRPIRPNEPILAVTGDFLVNPERDQDGYTMLNPGQVIAEGPDVKTLCVDALTAAEPEGIAPEREGRVCNPPGAELCLAVTPG